MKFIIQSVCKYSGRVGCIHDIERLPDVVFETPLVMMYTKGGSIPHITYEVLQMITREPLGIQVPISTTMDLEAAVSDFKMGLPKFIGLKDYLTYCTVQDPGTPTPQGFHERGAVSIFTREGKMQVDPDKYMDLMEAFCPDMYQILCDGNTNGESSKKRVQKAVVRTSQFFEACVDRHENSKVLQSSAMLGVIEGGYNNYAREISAKEIAQSPVSGFVIDGLHNNGPDVEHLPFERVKSVIKNTLKHLPEDKFRVVHGCWNPEAVLDMVELGIDIFDSTYPFLVSERGSALVFCNHAYTENTCLDTDINASNLAAEYDTVNGMEKTRDEITEKLSHNKNEINLVDKIYFDDFQPLCKSCSCLTCRKHTRSYIHHLLKTRELLGPVLLMVHNLHHYLEFFKSIRRALKEDSWRNFREKCHVTI